MSNKKIKRPGHALVGKWANLPPTEKQLSLLRQKGCKAMPKTAGEAAEKIADIIRGRSEIIRDTSAKDDWCVEASDAWLTKEVLQKAFDGLADACRANLLVHASCYAPWRARGMAAVLRMIPHRPHKTALATWGMMRAVMPDATPDSAEQPPAKGSPPSEESEMPPRIPPRRIVRLIDAMIAGRATDGIKSYQINNRRLDRYSISELLELRRLYAALAAREAAPNRLGRRIACYL